MRSKANREKAMVERSVNAVGDVESAKGDATTVVEGRRAPLMRNRAKARSLVTAATDVASAEDSPAKAESAGTPQAKTDPKEKEGLARAEAVHGDQTAAKAS